jgi:hypothetical protein
MHKGSDHIFSIVTDSRLRYWVPETENFGIVDELQDQCIGEGLREQISGPVGVALLVEPSVAWSCQAVDKDDARTERSQSSELWHKAWDECLQLIEEKHFPANRKWPTYSTTATVGLTGPKRTFNPYPSREG